uniref:Uncharacterized protein n=1 Tax=Anguilla anguilla TaxID=7936 RepID=A0A0E9S5U0_ANGAN
MTIPNSTTFCRRCLIILQFKKNQLTYIIMYELVRKQ